MTAARSFATGDTIVAIATPAGRGALGIVRIAGPEARALTERLLDPPRSLAPRHATFARLIAPALRDSPHEAVDHVVVTWFVAPHSYTGDDVVEITGHGSPVLLARMVALAMDQGARLAEPGEFTLRAYLNGRLDLAQAEAVGDLVDAVTPLQARAAMDQLEGTLTAAIGRIETALFDLAAKLEASLDFPEEGYHFVTGDAAIETLARLRADLDALACAGRSGRVIREGRLVVIVGPPNAGKSSLFNALAGADRAIVTDVPGTTRDMLTERIDVDGVPLTIVDTAGLRETTADAIEREGVARARDAQRVAALTLVVLDQSRVIDEADRAIVAAAARPRVVVASKTDLPAAWDLPVAAGMIGDDVVGVSARTGAGLADLRRAIVRALTSQDDWRDTPVISNVRHLALVDDARAALTRAEAAIADGATEEIVVAEITVARAALEAITGRRTSDDLLRHIFATFCIGK